jgi:hypothetical protein
LKRAVGASLRLIPSADRWPDGAADMLWDGGRDGAGTERMEDACPSKRS